MTRISCLMILSAGILWGSMGIFVRTLNAAGLGSLDIVFLRTLVTGSIMLVCLVLARRELLRIRIRDLWIFLGTGIASITFFNFCYFRAITVTSLSVAAVLLYTAPAMVMVMSYILFREPFSRRKGLSLGMTVLGCALVTGVLEQGQTVTPLGIALGLGAGFGYALYSIFSRYALERRYSTLTVTCYTFVIAALATAGMVHPAAVVQAVAGSPLLVFAAIAFGVLGTVMPYLLYTLGLRQVDNSQASILASIEPVTASVLGTVLFGERLTLPGLAGIVLVLLGMAVCSKPSQV